MTVIIAIIVSVCVYLYLKKSNTNDKREVLTILDVIETKNTAKETNNEKDKN